MHGKLEVLEIDKETLEKRSLAMVERDDATYFSKDQFLVIMFTIKIGFLISFLLCMSKKSPNAFDAKSA